MFCWTEIGAEHVRIIQRLICTCELLGINPYTYLTDVLLRSSEHPASRAAELTPECGKTPSRTGGFDQTSMERSTTL